MNTTDRALFANQLRAVAIIAVLIVHWCGIFWLARDTVASYIYAPAIEGPPSSMIFRLTIPTLNYGPFGVGIFFLISGFVIPFSLSRLSPAQFIISRAMRIYPTYIAASILTTALAYLSSRYWEQPFSISIKTFIANLALINGNIQLPSIDLVNWTLEIEIKFYLLCALFYNSIRNGNTLHYISIAVAILVFCTFQQAASSLLHLTALNGPLEALKTEIMFIPFMLIGTCFYHHYIESNTTKDLFISTMTLLCLFLLCWPHTTLAGQIPNVPQNYIYALILFSICYMLRRFFRPFPPLDLIANMSYSIYVLHSIIGYLTLRILMDKGLSFPASLTCTTIAILLISLIFHKLIEIPTMKLGKKIAASIKPNGKYGTQRSINE